MTVSIAASRRALTDPAPIDLLDPSLVPDIEVSIPVGVNLTLLGASETDIPGDAMHETFVQRVNVPLLASSVRASYEGGVDVITLDSNFHVRPGASAKSGVLDGVNTAVKLAGDQTPRLCVEVPSSPSYIEEAVALLTTARTREAAVMITLQDSDDYRDFERAAADARAAGVQVWLLAGNPEFTAGRADFVVNMFDATRVRTRNMSQARDMRFALKKAAVRAGRTHTVYADLGIVISATLQAAEERAIMLAHIYGAEPFAGIASVVGTVYDVADAMESWVGMGAADGLILTPASLPSDLASALKGVLPLLEARASIEWAE